MTFLEITQIIFNILGSLAMLLAIVFFILLTYHFTKLVKAVRGFADSISKTSEAIHQKIDNIFSFVSALPFAKWFSKKKSKK